MNEIYLSGAYASNNPDWHEDDAAWKAGKIVDILQKNKIHPKSICDIGCGVGEILRCLSLALPDCAFTGHEISPHAYAIAATKANDRLRFFLGDGLDDKKHYDVAMAIDVFEHVDDYLGFLRSMRRRAEMKLFHIPLDITAQGVLTGNKLLAMRNSVGHLHYFTKDTALETLIYTGHHIVDWTYTASSYESPGSRSKRKWLTLARRAMFSLRPDLAVRMLGGYSILALCK